MTDLIRRVEAVDGDVLPLMLSKPLTTEVLIPHRRQFAYDEEIETIVRLMWEMGLGCKYTTTRTDTYGGKGEYFTMIREITAGGTGRPRNYDFKLYFCRVQGTAGKSGTWNDCSGVVDLWIPGKHLAIHDDYSGHLDVFVGETKLPEYGMPFESKFDWNPYHQKMNKQPRTSLKYEFSANKSSGSSYRGRLNPYFVATTDSRDYSPKGNEPKYYETDQIIQEFKDYLSGVVLPNFIEEFKDYQHYR